MIEFVKLVKDVTDLSGDNPFFLIREGTVLRVVSAASDEEMLVIEHGGKQYPLSDDEYIEVSRDE